MDEKELLKHARKFVFNAIPEEIRALDTYDEVNHFDVYVEWRGKDSWAVVDRFGSCYDAQGKRDYEPQPSSRTKKFLKKYRFPLDEAIEIAQAVSKEMKLMRFNVEEFCELIIKRAAADEQAQQVN